MTSGHQTITGFDNKDEWVRKMILMLFITIIIGLINIISTLKIMHQTKELSFWKGKCPSNLGVGYLVNWR